MVARRFPKAKVAGSIPVSGTLFFNCFNTISAGVLRFAGEGHVHRHYLILLKDDYLLLMFVVLVWVRRDAEALMPLALSFCSLDHHAAILCLLSEPSPASSSAPLNNRWHRLLSNAYTAR